MMLGFASHVIWNSQDRVLTKRKQNEETNFIDVDGDGCINDEFC